MTQPAWLFKMAAQVTILPLVRGSTELAKVKESSEPGYVECVSEAGIPLKTFSDSRLVKHELLGKVRQIPAAVFGHQHHVFDTNRAQSRVVESWFDRDHMPFLEEQIR